MSDAVRSYASDAVIIVIGGFVLEGKADGTFVTIAPLGEGTISQSGADSEIARALSTDNRFSITVALQQTSLSNPVLHNIYNADRLSRGRGVVPVSVTDLSGTTQFAAGQAWVTNPPSAGWSKGIETREWVIHTGRPSIYVLGGAAP